MLVPAEHGSPDCVRPEGHPLREAVDAASAYETYDSLNSAIAGGDESPMVFLRMEYLRKLLEGRQPVPCRQDLPEHARFAGAIDDSVVLIVVSYCWCTSAHPDPDLSVLTEVCEFGKYLDESRNWGSDLGGRSQIGWNLGDDRDIALFWDYPSLYQKTAGRNRTTPQERSFKAGLGVVNVLYAHSKTWVLLATKAYRSLPYMDSGWPFFEWSLSQLVKPADLSLDLPAVLRFLRDSALDGKDNRSLQSLRDACRQYSRKLALVPDAFDRELEGKTVSSGADKALLKRKYRESFDVVLRPTTKFDLSELPCVDASSWASFLGETVPVCRRLRELDLSCNEAVSSTLEPFADAVALRSLDIGLCAGFHGALEPLRGLASLERLEAVGCAGLQGGLEPLAGLAALRVLGLEACAGLRGSVEQLAGLPELQDLRVQGTALSGWARLVELRPVLAGRRGEAGPDAPPTEDHLCLAALFGLVQAATRLLEAGALAGAPRGDGGLPLVCAAQNGHASICRLLLDCGAEADDDDRYQLTPLVVAAQGGHCEVVRLLVSRGAAVAGIHVDCMTPLHTAAYSGYPGVVQLLLDAGAPVGPADGEGDTPLHAAAQGGCCEAMELLLNRGANVGRPDHKGRTPLHAASFLGHREAVQLLLDHGATVEPVAEGDRTPLHEAARAGSCEAARVLLDSGAAVERPGDIGTSLHMAAVNGHREVARLLVDRGAASESVDSCGKTPLHGAAEYGRHEVVRLLLDQGAAPDRTDSDGGTPLHFAAYHGHCKSMRLLLDCRVAVDLTTSGGGTPLHYAAVGGHCEAARLLLDCSAAVDRGADGGGTALHQAMALGHLGVAQLLRERGACG